MFASYENLKTIVTKGKTATTIAVAAVFFLARVIKSDTMHPIERKAVKLLGRVHLVGCKI